MTQGFIVGASFTSDPFECNLTLTGFAEAERQVAAVDSKQCFAAMWFDDAVMDVFKTVISSAVKRAGFEALIIPMKQFNDDISDHIVAEIRKSRFVIADSTGLRGGVYYEAGFAAGLGKPVIHTCREDWFNKTLKASVQGRLKDRSVELVEIDEPRLVHFDLNHMNFIVWKDQADFERRLYDRIVVTVY